MKGRSALRRGPTPATAEKREVGEKGNVSQRRGGGGKAECNRLEEANSPPGCELGVQRASAGYLGTRGKGQPGWRSAEEGGQRQGLLQVRPREGDGQT